LFDKVLKPIVLICKLCWAQTHNEMQIEYYNVARTSDIKRIFHGILTPTNTYYYKHAVVAHIDGSYLCCSCIVFYLEYFSIQQKL